MICGISLRTTYQKCIEYRKARSASCLGCPGLPNPEQVSTEPDKEKQPEMKESTPAQPKQQKHPQSSPQAAQEAAKEIAKPPAKKTPTYRCFFCGEDHETARNSVGHIEFHDGEHKRKIYVCHYCSSKSLEDLLTKATPEQLQQAMGELLFQRALDSRSW
jgi:DNA-directed RNA polymerase subunit RPC12/RpoP